MPGHSYGGYKQSGIGREFSLEGMLDSFTPKKNLTVNLNATSAMWTAATSPSLRADGDATQGQRRGDLLLLMEPFVATHLRLTDRRWISAAHETQEPGTGKRNV